MSTLWRLGALLALLGPAPTLARSAGSVSSCGPTEVHTLAASPMARAYVAGGVAYGCAVGGSRTVRLGRVRSSVGSAGVGPVALAGRTVAYGVRPRGRFRARVIVRRLDEGRPLGSFAALAGFVTHDLVDSLVVKPDGAVAWIAEGWNPGAKEGETAVMLARHGHERQLDGTAAGNIPPASLRLHNSTLTWAHGGAPHSAMLR